MPDQKHEEIAPKSCMVKQATSSRPKKTVSWATDVYVTVDAESAYTLAIQGMQFFPPTTNTAPTAPDVPVPAAPPEVPLVTTEEDNQSHHSDSV